MRIAYYLKNDRKAAAFFYGETAVDLEEAAASAGIPLELIQPERLFSLEPEVEERLERLYLLCREEAPPGGRLAVPRLRLLPAVLSERNCLFYVGRNYKSVRADMNRATDKSVETLKLPAYFMKPPRAAAASGDELIACHEDTEKLDYEGEIGVVIGKKGKDIPLSEAADYIYGFTAMNDVSARDAMKAYYQMYKGKSMDTFAPVGPCIATKREIADPSRMRIETRVNGELRQSGDTSELIFGFPALVSILSRSMTLFPGDLISTGTPSGIGAAMVPPRFLQDGDVVEVRVEGVGLLRNRVRFYHRISSSADAF